EDLAPRVEHPPLDAGNVGVGDLDALDAALLEGRKVVARRPDARDVLLALAEGAGLESLEGDLAVAEIFETDHVEIRLSDVDRQILAPIIGHAPIGDESPLLELVDLIGARAQRRLERRPFEITLRVIGLREDRLTGGEKRQVARASRREAQD